jgi:threonine synthase
MDYTLRCTKCGGTARDPEFRCGRCKSILEVVYEYPRALKWKHSAARGIATYCNFLPIHSKLFSLGEGRTELRRFAFGKRVARLYLKLETENPTKTFKDRGSAVEITKAKELGFVSVCCASTGNMGYSLAHYAKSCGIRATIFISRNGNKRKIEKIRRAGARIVRVDGDFNAALRAAERFGRKNRVFVCGDYHYRKEGQKTLIYEVMEQLGFRVPDFIFVQIGNGTLFSGIYKGLLELKRASKIRRLPRLIAVQSERCDPVVSAWRRSGEVRYVKPETEADAIAVGFPTFGFECLRGLRATSGSAIAVSERGIEDAVTLLQKRKVYSELGGGTAMAGFLKMLRNSPSRLRGKIVVVVVTGNNEGRFRGDATDK